MSAQYWLFKTEPDEFSLEDLRRSPKKTTFWDGVRNYQARNMLRDEVQVGDTVLIYHSNAEPSAIVGWATVTRGGYPDPTALDPNDKHYDPKERKETPRWFGVDVRYAGTLARALPLPELRTIKALQGMELLRKGSRLSIQRVTETEFRTIMQLGDTPIKE